MIKSLVALFKRDREKFSIPRSVQDVIGIQCVWRDGIIRVGKELYSKTFMFSDINYAVASGSVKLDMFKNYAALLNSMECGEHAKITTHNRRINKQDFERKILLPLNDDELDRFRKEYNALLLDKAMSGNGIVQDRYLTITIHKKSIEQARAHFAAISSDIAMHFVQLGAVCVEMSLEERLRIAHSFFREGEESDYRFDLTSRMKWGHDFRDYICPDSFEFHSGHFKMGERYARALFFKDYASFIEDNMLSELCELNRSLMLSIDFIPIPTDEAVREVENRLLGVEKNITTWQQKQNANNNFSAQVPYDLEQQRKVTMEFLDELMDKDQRMFVACVTMVHVADSLEQLDADTEAIISTARQHMCQFGVLKYQQMDGLRSTLPYGMQPIKNYRTLTTNSLAVLMPFNAQEISHTHGIYYGQNAISKNAESGIYRQNRPCKFAWHIRTAAVLHHKCKGRQRSAQGWQRLDTIRQRLPERYRNVPAHDNQARRNGIVNSSKAQSAHDASGCALLRVTKGGKDDRNNLIFLHYTLLQPQYQLRYKGAETSEHIPGSKLKQPAAPHRIIPNEKSISDRKKAVRRNHQPRV